MDNSQEVIEEAEKIVSKIDHPELDSGENLLDQAAEFIREFFILPTPSIADLLAVWAAHTWVYQAAEYSPRIGIQSDDPGCGKSLLMYLTMQLCRNPEVLETYSPATFIDALTDKASKENPGTIGMDETDTVFRTERSQPKIQAAYNAGFNFKGADTKRSGSSGRIRRSVYCPVMFAGLSYLPRACMTRTISVYLHEIPKGKKFPVFIDKLHAPRGTAIGDALGAWARSQAAVISDAMPDFPEGCEARTMNKWWILFAVAGAAGGTWPDRIRAAYRELTEGIAPEAVISPLARLLGDVRKVWTGDRMASAVLVARLMELPDAPWGRLWPKDDALLAAKGELAAILRGARIEPQKRRIKDYNNGEPVQGYDKSMFQPFWDDMDARAAREETGTPEQAEQPS